MLAEDGNHAGPGGCARRRIRLGRDDNPATAARQFLGHILSLKCGNLDSIRMTANWANRDLWPDGWLWKKELVG